MEILDSDEEESGKVSATETVVDLETFSKS